MEIAIKLKPKSKLTDVHRCPGRTMKKNQPNWELDEKTNFQKV